MKCPFCGGVLPEAPPPSSPKSTAKERIISLLKSATDTLSPSEIARLSGVKSGTVRWALKELLAGGDVSKDECGYSLPNSEGNERSAEGVGEQTEREDRGVDTSFLGVTLNPALLAALEARYGGERG